MCTVSFYKNNDQVILTSNRDEHFKRGNALPPLKYSTQNFQSIYCQDTKSLGTWMALRNDGTAIVLLNGAFEKHRHEPLYKKSRGLVLLDIINNKNCLQTFKGYDLTKIEPFTIILYSNDRLFECIWNGSKKHMEEKFVKQASIWSSVTLYELPYRLRKKALYEQLIKSKDKLNTEDLLQFHNSKEDLENGFVINRNNQLLTFSITQIVLNKTSKIFYHHDLFNQKIYSLM